MIYTCSFEITGAIIQLESRSTVTYGFDATVFPATAAFPRPSQMPFPSRQSVPRPSQRVVLSRPKWSASIAPSCFQPHCLASIVKGSNFTLEIENEMTLNNPAGQIFSCETILVLY